MDSRANQIWHPHLGTLSLLSRAALLAGLVLLGMLSPDRSAQAAEKLVAAAQIANAGLAACERSRSKALYNCIADVLDRMSNDLSAIRRGVPNTQSALRSAASRLRAATTKAEALSAVTQCQAVIAGALRQVQAAGANGRAQGWGDSGLAAVAGVLARAARLIQTTG